MWAAHKVKILSALLSLSVLANIAMGGMVAGKQTAKWAWHPRQSMENILRAAKDIPPEQREEVKESLKKYGGQLRESGNAIRTQREHIRTLTMQEPLDKAKLMEALSELRTLMGKTQALGHEMAIEVIDKIPPSQRAKLFERGKGKERRHEP